MSFRPPQPWERDLAKFYEISRNLAKSHGTISKPRNRTPLIRVGPVPLSLSASRARGSCRGRTVRARAHARSRAGPARRFKWRERRPG